MACATRTVIVCLALWSATAIAVSFVQVGEGITGAKNPSFVDLFSVGEQPEAIWITDFDVLSSGSVYTLPDWKSQASSNFSSVSLKTVATGFAWPNSVSAVPAQALRGVTDDAILVPDGFLVPFHSDGGMYIVTLGDGKKYKISQDHSGWFYHMGLWVDMNGDGLLDVLTARATKPIIGAAQGVLVWLEQPSDPLSGSAWTEHQIVDGPDVMFRITDVDPANSTLTLASCQFFSSLLTLTTVSTKDGSLLSHSVIDQNIGPAYSIEYVDVDGDGVKDLLVTNHMGDGSGGVFLYSGQDFMHKRVLSQGYPVVSKSPGSAAPGFAYAVRPQGLSPDSPAYILVAGDGSGAAYLLSPSSPNTTYTRQTVKDIGSTVGSIGLDNDSDSFFFVPAYNNGIIYPFRFQS